MPDCTPTTRRCCGPHRAAIPATIRASTSFDAPAARCARRWTSTSSTGRPRWPRSSAGSGARPIGGTRGCITTCRHCRTAWKGGVAVMTDPIDVLVVGAGPVGLTAAIEVARLGRSVRVVDAADSPATSSRALGVHARTQEVLDRLGLLDELRRRSTPVAAFSVHAAGHRLARLALDLSPTPSVVGESRFLAQVDTVAMLRAELARHGVEPEWGTRVVAIDQDGDGVAATLERSG